MLGSSHAPPQVGGKWSRDGVARNLGGMTDMDSWEAVADGHGLASTGDALAAGLTKRDLAALVKDG